MIKKIFEKARDWNWDMLNWFTSVLIGLLVYFKD